MNSKIHVNVQLSYDDFSLDVQCDINATGVTVIFGRSGSGKTTLLRCLAGLEKPDRGQITVNGVDWLSDKAFIPPHRRPIGYVFQEASLFSHLDVNGNLRFALSRVSKNTVPAEGIILSFDDVVRLCGVLNLLSRKPQQLSGGERQRVAIARALLIQPKVLLMDEPLASLDEDGKRDLLSLIERLKREVKIPILYVTHSVNEVVRIADEVLVLDHGQVKSHGGVDTVFNQEMSCLDDGNPGSLVEAIVAEKDSEWHMVNVTFPGGSLCLRDSNFELGQELRILIPAKDVSITLAKHDDSSILNILPAKILSVIDIDGAPDAALVQLSVGDTLFRAQVTQRSVAHLALSEGQSVWIQIKAMSILN